MHINYMRKYLTI